MPNPSRGPVEVMLALYAAGSATLELYDLAGRVVESLVVSSAQLEYRRVRIGGGVRSPGVYWLGLRQGARRASAKVVIAP